MSCIQTVYLPDSFTPLRKLYLYHCDPRGLPLALVCHDGMIAWLVEHVE
ncbi:RHS domain-containing protein [Enterobacter cloacae]